jgi:hypothetical protein
MPRRKWLLTGLLLLAIILVLCSCKAPTPTPVPTPEDVSSDEILMTFELDGGIAGLCHELAIQRGGGYRLSSCRHADTYGQLAGQFLAQLQEWDAAYAPFEVRVADAPGSADSLTKRLIWRGSGREPTSEETRQEILNWMTELPVADLRAARAEQGVLQSAKAYLAETTGFDEAEVSLTAYEAANWPDASLGCPQEGQSYAQVATAGYSVHFIVADKDYEVHTNADGSSAVLCLKAAPEEAFTVYSSPELLFSIAHPRGWATAVLNESGGNVTISPDRGDPSLGLSVTAVGDGYTADEAGELLADYRNSVSNQDPSAVFVDDAEVLQATGARGVQLSYYVALADEHFRHFTAAVLVSEQGLAFRLLLWTPREEYWDHAGDFSRILHSFQTLSKTRPTAEATTEPAPTGAPTPASPDATPAPPGMFVGTFEGYIEAPNIPNDRSSVRGRVLDANGNPMVGHTLRLSAFDWHIDHTTGGDGTYAFDWLEQELTFTVTPLSFAGNPVDVLTEFGKAGIVNYQQP